MPAASPTTGGDAPGGRADRGAARGAAVRRGAAAEPAGDRSLAGVDRATVDDRLGDLEVSLALAGSASSSRATGWSSPRHPRRRAHRPLRRGGRGPAVAGSARDARDRGVSPAGHEGRHRADPRRRLRLHGPACSIAGWSSSRAAPRRRAARSCTARGSSSSSGSASRRSRSCRCSTSTSRPGSSTARTAAAAAEPVEEGAPAEADPQEPLIPRRALSRVAPGADLQGPRGGGVASRRGADELVTAGRSRWTAGWRSSASGSIRRRRRSRSMASRSPRRRAVRSTLLLKPAGVTSTVRDRHAATTVVDLVPPSSAGGGAPVPGRAARPESEGLLLLTNDGTGPTQSSTRATAWSASTRSRSAGSSTGTRQRRSSEASSWPRDSRRSPGCAARRGPRIGGSTTSSNRRPIPRSSGSGDHPPGLEAAARRMFAGVGAPVRRLVRVRIGTLRLDELAAGDVRVLSAAEVRRLVPRHAER